MTLIGWGGNSDVHLINGKIEKRFQSESQARGYESKWQLLTSTNLRRVQVTLSPTKGNIVNANNINDFANENGYFVSANTQIPPVFGDDIKHLNLSSNYKSTSKYKAYLSFMKEELDVDIDESKIDLFLSSNNPHCQPTFGYNGKEFPIILFSKAELIVYYKERVSEILNFKEFLFELNKDLLMATCNNVFVPSDAYFFRVNPKTRMMDYILADFDLVEKMPHHLKNGLQDPNILELGKALQQYFSVFVLGHHRSWFSIITGHSIF